MYVICSTCCQFIARLNLFAPKSPSIVRANLKRLTNYSPLLHFKDKHLLPLNAFNGLTIRCLSQSIPSVDYHKKNQKLVTKCLIQSFGLQLKEVETIYENYPDFNDISINDLQNNISLLEDNELFLAEVVTKRSWVLLLNESSLSYGIQVLEDYNQLNRIRKGDTYLLALFLVNESQYIKVCKRFNRKRFTLFSDFDERMDYFCHNLDTNCQMFCSIVGQNLVIVSKDMTHIKRVMQLLKDNGVSNENILKDHWIFNHNIQTMEKRIEECKQINHPIRLWTLRCPDKVWNPLMDRWKQKCFDYVLNEEQDNRSLLINSLNCRDIDIDFMLYKNHRLLDIKQKKLDQMIKLVFGLGYTSADIMRSPRLFNYSIQRVKRRLTDQRLEKPDLAIIMETERDFLKLIESKTRESETLLT